MWFSGMVFDYGHAGRAGGGRVEGGTGTESGIYYPRHFGITNEQF